MSDDANDPLSPDGALALLDQIDTPLWLLPADGARLRWANAAAVRRWGEEQTRALAEGEPTAIAALRRLVEDCLARLNAGVDAVETQATDPDGTTLPVRCRLAPREVANGATLILVEAVGAPSPGRATPAAPLILRRRGIGRALATRPAAPATEPTLRAMIEGVEIGVAAFDADLRLVAHNERLIDLLDPPFEVLRAGTSRDEFLRAILGEEAAREFGPATVAPALLRRLQRARFRRGSLIVEARGMPADGGGFLVSFADVSETARTEQALTEKSALLVNTLSAIGQGFCVFDADLRLRAWNQLYFDLMGHPQRLAQVGMPLTQFIADLARRGEYGDGSIEQHMRERLGNASRREAFEFERQRPSGQVVAVRHLPLPEGGFVRTYTDITARKRAELALAQRDRLAAAMGDAASQVLRHGDWREPIGKFLAQIGEIVGASRVFLARNGDGPDGVLTQGDELQWTAPGTDARPAARAQLVFRADEHPFMEWRRRRSRGETIQAVVRDLNAAQRAWYEPLGVKSLVRVPVFVEGRWWGTVGIDDCTHERVWPAAEIDALTAAAGLIGMGIGRAGAEKALRESEERFRAIVEGNPLRMVIARESDGRLMYASPLAAEALGLATEEIVGRHAVEFYANQEDRHRFFEELGRTGRVEGLEIEIKRADASTFWAVITTRRAIYEGEAVLVTGLFDVTERKKLEMELRRATERYELALDGANEVIWDWEAETGLTTFSARAIEMFGHPRDRGPTITPEEWQGYIHPDDVESYRLAIGAHFTGKTKIYRCDYRVRANRNDYIWVQDRGVALRDAKGHAYRMSGSIGDITERKQATERLEELVAERTHDLAEQTATLEATFAHMSDGIAVLDRDLRFVTWNRRYGYNLALPEGMLQNGLAFLDVARHLAARGDFGPGDAETLAHEYAQAMIAEQAGEARERNMPDGRIVEDESDRLPEGGLVLTNRDITERRRAQRALERVRVQLQDAIEAFADGFVLYGPDGRLVVCNEKFRAIYGEIAPMLVPGVSFEAITRAAYRANVFPTDGLPEERWVKRAMRMQSEAAVDFELKLTSGRWFRVSQRRTREGGTVGIRTDVTDLKRREEELRVARDQAESANRAKSTFLATMSHEIRTPMNGVLGLLELLQETQLTRDQQDLVTVVRGSASALLQIIDDILDFSKIEAGRLEIAHADTSVAELVEGVAETLAHNAHRKSLSLLTFVDPEMPAQVRCDPVRVRQILFNLVGNAIKFTEEGSVTVEARIEADPGGRTILHGIVRDTGIGLTREEADRLFRPFVQADDSTTRRFGGTGLGLSICRRLVDMMDGDIGIDSEPGRGSTFWFKVPVELVADAAMSDRTLLAELSVLVVDDDATARTIMARYLTAAGARVMSAADQAAALAQAARRVDLAILDMRLPDSDGLTLGRRLREVVPGLPLVLLTAFDAADVRDAARAQNFTAYLSKPVRRSVLVRAAAAAAGRLAEPMDEMLEPAERLPALEAPTVEEALAADRLILVAEDNPTNQALVMRQLGRLGYAAELFPDGRSAFEAFQRRRYALVLTDVHMPGMDGFQLTETIRQGEIGSGRRTPIVALTANVMQGEAERCLSAGMDAYLGKPVGLMALGEMLQRWLAPGAPRETPPDAGAHGRPPSNAPALDEAHVRETFGELDEEVRRILDVFLQSTQDIATEIGRALVARDREAARDGAHSIKGAARSAGAVELAAVAAELEQAVKTEHWDDAVRLHGGLLPALHRAAAAIETLMPGRSTAAE